MIKGNYLKKVLPILLIITIFGLPMGSIANATMVTPVDNVIVVLDDYDPAITDAVNTLKEDLDQYKILKYGTFEYMWTVGLKPIQNAILVGHGLDDVGVLINGDIVSWQNYANIANKINAENIHFLNCGSGEVKKYLNENKIGVTFDNKIDGTSAALVTAIAVLYSQNKISLAKETINKTFKHLDTLKAESIDESKLLYFSSEEKDNTVSWGMFLAVLAMLDVYIHWSHYAPFAITIMATIWLPMEILHLYVLAGEMWEGFVQTWEIIKILYNEGLVSFLYDHLSWSDALAAVAILTVLVGLAVITKGTSQYVWYVALASSFAFWANWFKIDYDDCDGEFHHEEESCYVPPPPPGGGPY